MPNSSPRSKQAPKREKIVDYLARQGGKITSDDGRGLTASMAKAVGYRDVTVLNNMLARLENEGVITRDVRGRRTFAISLRGRGRAASSNGKRPASARRTTTASKTARPARRATTTTRSTRTQLASTVTDLAGRLGEALAALAVENQSLVRRIEQLEKSGTPRRATGTKRAPSRRRATAARGARTTRARRAA